MKQLKKVQLQDAKELTNNQMKNITGGNPETSGNGCTPTDSSCNGKCGDIINGTYVSGSCSFYAGICACHVG